MRLRLNFRRRDYDPRYERLFLGMHWPEAFALSAAVGASAALIAKAIQ